MSSEDVRTQYEAYPYPERDPADEARRLITGSPSWPQEMDHWLWGGARDWSKPLRALVAGGGTGDGLIQLAQLLTSAGRPHEITYLDLSEAARAVAEARAKARGLTRIHFVTGSLLDAAEHGRFDYIDCCGVLHHLDAPQAGFDALAAALAPGGSLGLMVYAPLGRSGVYPLQSAFTVLYNHLSPQEKLAKAKALFRRLPEGHPFKRNPHLVDHEASDAGFFDLLLHSTDRPFTITELAQALDRAGLEIAGTPEPALYDPAALLPEGQTLPDGLDPIQAMQLAEDLRGTFKTHIVYAVPRGARRAPPLGKPGAIPHLRGIDPRRLAQSVAQKGQVRLTAGGEKLTLPVPKQAAPLIAGIDGRQPLSTLAQSARLDPIAFATLWGKVERAFCPHGHLHYSTLYAS
ncbi:class I SAM-dependent methyltransferase [Psychromarinibacter sp. C21-152]|uniref:Class I SAM-dependent methyltransferase n=1 Tax=Psychromarinibacter sediminicola TaxID=3033385 RepID=A0AAE3NR75_9RHOB|nr:class I SAM-dependent methyltransferase [Psychromarinibacter sediminicola]MDF0600526.1 class I SAM-dependent methyltransferase [Psychromarinibacter sediminicola]